MNNLKIDDFIEDYPLQDDPEIQWKTACRKEFNVLKSKKDKQDKYGNFFNHQELILRYIRQYDRIFNPSGTGVGKTATIIRIAEYYKKSNEDIKRVYLLASGPSLVENFKSQIVKLSSPEDYSNEKISKASTQKTVKNNLTRLINTWYSIETYNQFHKTGLSDEEIEKTYSDCIIFMDEAHRINPYDNSVSKEGNKKEIENIYNYLWRITHLAKRTKIIVSTATPMVNLTKSFASLFNLLLPQDFQLPLNVDNNFYDKVTLDQLEPFFRGKITYIKFLETNINVLKEGKIFDNYKHKILFPASKKTKGQDLLHTIKRIEDGKIITVYEPLSKEQPLVTLEQKEFSSQTNIYTLEMKGIQKQIYLKYADDKKNFFFNPIQTSIFVFPNGTFGKDGFFKYTTIDRYKSYQFLNEIEEIVVEDNRRVKKILPGLPHFLKKENKEEVLEQLGMMSCKFKFLIEKEWKASQEEKPGNAFCYIEIVEASGAVLLGMLLNYFGFEEFKLNSNNFDIKTGKLINLEKRKRFAFLTGSSSNIENSIKVFNSRENMHGEYIQLVIASAKVREGITISNVLRGYIMSPGWHESGTYQAIGRIIRADSHNYLLEERKKNNITGNLVISVYKLAGVIPENEKYLNNGKITQYSIDVTNYMRAEEKDIKIKRIMRFMKQTAFDAFINYERNTYTKNENYSPSDADYETLYYKIFNARGPPFNKKRTGMAYNQGPNSGEYIYNTYNLLYINDKVDIIKKELFQILKYKNIISIEDLIQELKTKGIKFTPYIFFASIDQIINNNEIFSNEDNTIYYKIKKKGLILYRSKLDNKNNDNNRINNENNYYISLKYPTVNSFIERKKEFTVGEEITNMNKKEIIDYYEKNQNYDYFKNLIEGSLINDYENNLTRFDKDILEIFNNYILVIPKPKGYLEIAQKYKEGDIDKKTAQGRTRDKDSTAGFKNLNLDKFDPKEDTSDMVYVHFYKSSEKTAFAITSIFETTNKDIKILDKNSLTFKEAGIVENYVYNYLFTKKYNELMKNYKKSKYYGTYILRGGEKETNINKKRNNFFRIIDTSKERNKGQICKTETYENLVEIIKYLNPNFDTRKKMKRDFLCQRIKEEFEKKNLLFFSM